MLTYQYLSFFNEMSIGPKPADVIEVRHIKNIKLKLRKLRLTIKSKKLTVTLEFDSELTFKTWKAAFTKINCSITPDSSDEGEDNQSSGIDDVPPYPKPP